MRGRVSAGLIGWMVAAAVAQEGEIRVDGSQEAVEATGASVVASPEDRAPERTASASVAAGDGGEELPVAMERLRAANAQVVPLGAAEGLRGFLVRRPGGDTYAAYVTETGAVAVGLLIGRNGEDVTRRQLEAAGEAGVLSMVRELDRPARARVGEGVEERVARLLEETRNAEGFRVGDRGPVIHVFADPTCPYSVEHVRALADDARSGTLRAHIIPVGVLGERSAQRAVQVAGAADPHRAWETGWGGTVDRAAGAARVAANLRMHARWGVRGVPFSVWEGPEGARVYYGAGRASSFAVDVVSVGGP